MITPPVSKKNSPLFPNIRPASNPTHRAHPDKSEWFHCAPTHTMLNERLGLPENKTMKLLTSPL